MANEPHPLRAAPSRRAHQVAISWQQDRSLRAKRTRVQRRVAGLSWEHTVRRPVRLCCRYRAGHAAGHTPIRSRFAFSGLLRPGGVRISPLARVATVGCWPLNHRLEGRGETRFRQTLRQVATVLAGASPARGLVTTRAAAHCFTVQVLLAKGGSMFGRPQGRVTNRWRAGAHHLMTFPWGKVAKRQE